MSVTACAPTPQAPTRRNHLSGKRTNSLGWAKSDCHTCSALRRHCDRRRPRCSACLADGVICAGYVQQLNWERGSLRQGKSRAKASAPKNKETAKSRAADGATAQLPQPSAFVFVDQSDLPDRSRVKTRKDSKSSKWSNTNPSPSGTVARGSVSSTWESISPTSASSPWSLTRANTPPSIQDSQLILPLSPQIARHPGDVEDALSFYHSCFSYVTLTFPVQVNPWQAALPQINDDIPCVRYAAIALAQRQQAHLRSKPEGLSVLNLKARALSIFATHLNDLPLESGISTALLLIALDYAETGFSNWTIHLRGAFRILESNGGIRLAESRPNLRSQIAMLIWYDINAALISRCGPIFPRRYLETLMLWQSESEWSILALNGLPDGMFLDMYGLAVAAAHPETVTPETIAEFETRIVTAEISDQGNRQLALMSQVWKLGLLLYCRRVFLRHGSPVVPTDTTLPPMDAAVGIAVDLSTRSASSPHDLSLQILRMVTDLPPDSNFQKQCLLPIILAAGEMTTLDWQYRTVAVQYCERWKRKTGIWIFDSGLEFMSAIWALNDSNTDADVDGDGGAQDSGLEGDAMEGVDQADHDHRGTRGLDVPWTEIFPPGVEHGFLFG